MTGPKPRRYTWADLGDQDPGRPVPHQAAAAGLRRYTMEDLAQPADAAQAPFADRDTKTGLPPDLQLGLLGAGNDADQERYLQKRGYQTMRHPTHGLLWFNQAEGKWADLNKDGLDKADIPQIVNLAAEGAAMGLGATGGAAMAGAASLGNPVAAGAGGMVGSGLALGAVRALRKPLIRALTKDDAPDTRTVPEGLQETGDDIMEGAGGQLVAKGVSAVGAMRSLRRLKQWALPPFVPKLVTPAAEAAARADLPVTIGTFSESGPVRGLTKFFRTLPTGGPLQQAREDLLTATTRKVDALGDLIGPELGSGAAQHAQQSVARTSYLRKSQYIGTMDDRIGKVLDARLNGVPELANLEGVAARFERQIAASKGADAPYFQEALTEIRRVLAAANSDPAKPGLPFKSVKQLRTTLGAMARSETAAGKATPLPTVALKEIEQALDADIGQAAKRVGGGVEQYWKRRNAWIAQFRSSENPIQWDDYIRAVESGEGKRVLDYVERWDRSDARRVRAVRANAMADPKTRGDWDIIARERWDRMGRVSEGSDYDAVIHLKRLNDMPPAVQEAYWGGKQYAGAIQGLKDLRPVIEKIRVEGIRPPNPAGDPGSVSQIRALLFRVSIPATIGGLANPDDPATGALKWVAGATALTYSASRLLASPAFGRWLKTTATMAPNATRAETARHITRLLIIAKREKIEDVVVDYLNSTNALLRANGGEPLPFDEKNLEDTSTVAKQDTTGLGRIKSLRALLDSANMDLRQR